MRYRMRTISLAVGFFYGEAGDEGKVIHRWMSPCRHKQIVKAPEAVTSTADCSIGTIGRCYKCGDKEAQHA